MVTFAAFAPPTDTEPPGTEVATPPPLGLLLEHPEILAARIAAPPPQSLIRASPVLLCPMYGPSRMEDHLGSMRVCRAVQKRLSEKFFSLAEIHRAFIAERRLVRFLQILWGDAQFNGNVLPVDHKPLPQSSSPRIANTPCRCMTRGFDDAERGSLLRCPHASSKRPTVAWCGTTTHIRF